MSPLVRGKGDPSQRPLQAGPARSEIEPYARSFLASQNMRPDLIDWTVAQPDCALLELARAGGYVPNSVRRMAEVGRVITGLEPVPLRSDPLLMSPTGRMKAEWRQRQEHLQQETSDGTTVWYRDYGDQRGGPMPDE